jgi:hypothetical protein
MLLCVFFLRAVRSNSFVENEIENEKTQNVKRYRKFVFILDSFFVDADNPNESLLKNINYEKNDIFPFALVQMFVYL